MRLLFVIGLFAVACTASPTIEWTNLNDNLTLTCPLPPNETTCIWATPFGEHYQLYDHLTGDDGRLTYRGNETHCGIEIPKVQKKDVGVWTCRVRVVEGTDASSKNYETNVTIIKPPSSMAMNYEWKNDSSPPGIHAFCIANHADPKPVFQWFLDASPVVQGEITEKTTGSAWVSILKYIPYNNATLRCVVEQIGLNGSMEKSSTIKVPIDGHNADSSPEYLWVSIFVPIAVFVCGILCILSLRTKKRHDDSDKEANELIEVRTEETQDENTELKTDEAKDENKDEEKTAKSGLRVTKEGLLSMLRKPTFLARMTSNKKEVAVEKTSDAVETEPEEAEPKPEFKPNFDEVEPEVEPEIESEEKEESKVTTPPKNTTV